MCLPGDVTMLEVKGATRGEYLQFECESCGSLVYFSDLRWVGGVPQVRVACNQCDRQDDLKLHPPAWIEAFPPPSSS